MASNKLGGGGGRPQDFIFEKDIFPPFLDHHLSSASEKPRKAFLSPSVFV